MNINLDSKIPEGPMADKWSNYVAGQKLVNPSNKRKFKIMNHQIEQVRLSHPTPPLPRHP